MGEALGRNPTPPDSDQCPTPTPTTPTPPLLQVDLSEYVRREHAVPSAAVRFECADALQCARKRTS